MKSIALLGVTGGVSLAMLISPLGVGTQRAGAVAPQAGPHPGSAVTSATVASLPTKLTRTGRIPGTICPAFPKRNYWRTSVKKLPRHKKSKRWVKSIGRSARLHPDFGPAFGEQSIPYGIPVTVVSSSHPTVPVKFGYASESDHVRYPLGSDTVIEGGPESSGDRHAIVVNKDTCTLYETWNTRKTGSSWRAGSGAVWNLRSNALRPRGWTSADAAGLPILPGLLTYDEVKRGKVKHAIRFTAPVTQDRFVWPARHKAGATTSGKYPPMGARFRLRKSFSVEGWSRDAKVILRGMKRYGLVLADNGSPWFFQGTADSRWPSSLVQELKRIPAGYLEAVKSKKMKVRSGSGRAKRR